MSRMLWAKSLAKMAFLSLLLVSLVATSGCSLFGGGKKKKDRGDMGLSENELGGTDSMRENRFGSNSIPTAEREGLFRDVSFDYDSAVISSEGQQDIEYNAEKLRGTSGTIKLEGHTDERGTSEYNLALGQARARAVSEALVALGIPSSRLSVISYGEEIPVDPGHSEEAYAQNRRVHFAQ